MADLSCPKCRAEMEPGFLVDNTYGGVATPELASGEHTKSFWSGTKMKGRRRIEVTTYRCSRCGYLEAYAADEGSA